MGSSKRAKEVEGRVFQEQTREESTILTKRDGSKAEYPELKHREKKARESTANDCYRTFGVGGTLEERTLRARRVDDRLEDAILIESGALACGLACQPKGVSSGLSLAEHVGSERVKEEVVETLQVGRQRSGWRGVVDGLLLDRLKGGRGCAVLLVDAASEHGVDGRLSQDVRTLLSGHVGESSEDSRREDLECLSTGGRG